MHRLQRSDTVGVLSAWQWAVYCKSKLTEEDRRWKQTDSQMSINYSIHTALWVIYVFLLPCRLKLVHTVHTHGCDYSTLQNLYMKPGSAAAVTCFCTGSLPLTHSLRAALPALHRAMPSGLTGSFKPRQVHSCTDSWQVHYPVDSTPVSCTVWRQSALGLA